MSICNEQSIPLDKYKEAFSKRFNFIYIDKIKKKIKRSFIVAYNIDGII